MNETEFEQIKERYGLHSSWAVWSDLIDKPKSGMDDLTIFEKTKGLSETLKFLKPNIILVALNLSTIKIATRLSNFHGKNGEVYKVRHAIKGTPLWGAYMTDIIKDYLTPVAIDMMDYLHRNPNFEQENIRSFINEVNYVSNSRDIIFVALGKNVFEILDRQKNQIEKGIKEANYNRSVRIFQIPHYGWKVDKDTYRESVLKQLQKEKIL